MRPRSLFFVFLIQERLPEVHASGRYVSFREIDSNMRYLAYSEYMKRKYGGKVYKLPVNLPVTCPNRMGDQGCTFCGEQGAGFENLSASLSVTEQLRRNMEYIGKRYGADLFAAYFQNFTNTFLPLEEFRDSLEEAVRFPEVAEICISTRPDCISDAYLDAIAAVCGDSGKSAVIELGLQSISHRTLKKINRGHSLAEFIDGTLRCQKRGFEVCAHLILNLPWDDDEDAEEAAKVLSALKVGQVKLHSLYIEKGTELCRQYENGEFQLIGPEEYARRAVRFLRFLSPEICVQRLVSRAPEENTVFCNWGMSWWRIRDLIDEIMETEDIFQGDKCDYLNRDYYFWLNRENTQNTLT